MSITRLLSLQAENDRAGVEMLIEGERFDLIRGIKPRAVSSFNLFQTPEIIAEYMVSKIPQNLNPSRILEPSAGLGRLYRTTYSRFPKSEYTLVENSPDCSMEIWYLPVNFLQRDFLSVTGGEYDLIIMNPPFKMGCDVKHIKHALSMLAPGGVLVSLCYNGVKQNRDLKPISTTWEVLPEGSFKSEGTGASVVLLTIER